MLAIYLSEPSPSLNHPCNYEQKSTRQKERYERGIPLLRTFARRLAVSRSASMRRLTNFLVARANARSRGRFVLPRSVFLSFFSYHYFIFFNDFFSRDSKIAGTVGSVVSPFPSPEERTHSTSFVAKRSSFIPVAFFIRSDRNTRRREIVASVWRQSWIKYYFEKTSHVFWSPFPRRHLQLRPPPFPSVRPPRSIPLLIPLRLGDPAGGCWFRRREILRKAESARPLRATLNQSSGVCQLL